MFLSTVNFALRRARQCDLDLTVLATSSLFIAP
jgi:hypothetical protein